ncbi:hypothetical protein [Parabacteroides sp. Marseille-P3160]|uniref:hypothetical protein n=1 Tax=Parabacteroides sp. Marseille-P3160 TaxID=1917887 RepID=UPI0009BA5BF2|nr:hypothetical protein [Parabacteroides sp. Marseille-P3160]
METNLVRVSKDYSRSDETGEYGLYIIQVDNEAIYGIKEDQMQFIYQKIEKFIGLHSREDTFENAGPVTKTGRERLIRMINSADSIVQSFLPYWIDYASYQIEEYGVDMDAKSLLSSLDVLGCRYGRRLIDAIEEMNISALSHIKKTVVEAADKEQKRKI